MRSRLAKGSRSDQRGFVLVTCYLVVTLALAYCSAGMVRSLMEQSVAQRSFRLASAFALAEAGIDDAITILASNPNWSGTAYTPVRNGGYDVTVSVISPTLRRLTSTGHSPSNVTSAYGYQQKQVEAVVSVPSGLFAHALFAAEDIRLKSNAKTDSYNSSTGAYGDNGNISAKGGVGSNAIAAGTIDLDSNVHIDGNVSIGPGGNVNTAIVVAGNAEITGTKEASSELKTLSPTLFTYTSGTSTETLTSSQTLPAGTYHYAYVNLDSNSTVEVTGDATIYVDQYFRMKSNTDFVTTCSSCTLTLYVKGTSTSAAALALDSNTELSNDSGGSINIYVNGSIDPGTDPPAAVEWGSNSALSANDLPPKLSIVVAMTDTNATTTREVEMKSNTTFFGTVNAPRSSIRQDSNATVYGAMIGRTIHLGSNATVHYDTSLNSGGSGSGPSVQLRSWREL